MRKHMWSACCHTQAGMARTSNALLGLKLFKVSEVLFLGYFRRVSRCRGNIRARFTDAPPATSTCCCSCSCTCLKPLLLTLLRLLFVLAVSSLLETPAAARRSAASKEQARST